MARALHPTWGGVIGLFVVTAGWLIGLRPLADNSFLTHLATGRLILDTGSVPGHDPYTFTAAGEPWVVQSWLVSVLYATAESLGGLGAVRIVVGLLAALLTGLGWRLLRPADGVVPRLAAAALFVGVGASLWAERPLMVGLVCLAFVLLALEQGLDPRWLLPMGWLWVNSHGSFPLGVLLVVLSALGRRLEGESAAVEWRALAVVPSRRPARCGGSLGWEVLVFPLELLATPGRVEQRGGVAGPDVRHHQPAAVHPPAHGDDRAPRPSTISPTCAARGDLRRSGAAVAAERACRVARDAARHGRGLAGLGSLSSHARPRVTRMVAAVAVAGLVVAHPRPVHAGRPRAAQVPRGRARVPRVERGGPARGPARRPRLRRATSSTTSTARSGRRSTTTGSTCSPTT